MRAGLLRLSKEDADDDVSRRNRDGARTPERGDGCADATGDGNDDDTSDETEAECDKDECRDEVDAVGWTEVEAEAEAVNVGDCSVGGGVGGGRGFSVLRAGAT